MNESVRDKIRDNPARKRPTKAGGKHIFHGCSNGKHFLYSRWSSMRSRCFNPNTVSWKYYGAKGITCCERWDDFRNFLKDMESGYFRGATIERIDNTGDYTPENCCWATQAQQRRNYSRARKMSWNGKTMTITDWSKLSKVSWRAFFSRIDRGWTIEEAVILPKNTSVKYARDKK